MKTFEINITGIDDFDEQCRIQCSIQNHITINLGYECNSNNFKINFK